MNTLYSLLSTISLISAIFKGPRYLSAFMVRRGMRRVANRHIRKVKW